MKTFVPSGMENYVKDWNMSPAIEAGGFIYLTGMTGAGPDGNVDPIAGNQIRLAFERTEEALQSAGLNFSHVVEMTSYHKDIQSHIRVFREIRSEFVSEPYPAWTAIEVEGFVTPGTICELRIVAYRGDAS